MVKCKECGKEFKDDASLHRHIKQHGYYLHDYYIKYYPRFNLLNGQPLPFENKKHYFSKDFVSHSQMLKWFKQEGKSEKTKKYAINKVKERIKDKGLTKVPCHLDLYLSELPTVPVAKWLFGSFGNFAREVGCEPTYSKGIVSGFFDPNLRFDEMKILVDTREQKPLSFPKTSACKLDFGDYTVGGEDYSYTYIDRKSEADFCGTMTGGFERFRKELQRARDFNGFLYVLVEGGVESTKKNFHSRPKRGNSCSIKFVWKNMKDLIYEYSDVCQFLFSGSRAASQFLVPRLLHYGKDLWNCDLQYFIDERVAAKKKGKS